MRTFCVTLVTMLIVSATASAGVVVWTLTGVTFTDGGTASGSFSYDASLDQYSAVHIITTAGSMVGGATYQFVGAGWPADAGKLLVVTAGSGDLTGTPGFAMIFASPLDGLGGTRDLSYVKEASCADASCSAPAGAERGLVAGSVIGTAEVPEPSSMLLLGIGMALLALRRQRFLRR